MGRGVAESAPLAVFSLLSKCSSVFFRCLKLHLSQDPNFRVADFSLSLYPKLYLQNRVRSRSFPHCLLHPHSDLCQYHHPIPIRAPAAAAVILCTVDQMVSLCQLCSHGGASPAGSGPSQHPLHPHLCSLSPSSLGSARVLFSQVSRWLSTHTLGDAALRFMMQLSSALPNLFPCTCFVFLSSSDYLLAYSDLCVVCLLPRFCLWLWLHPWKSSGCGVCVQYLFGKWIIEFLFLCA